MALLLLLFLVPINAQIATDEVPPFQWLNLTSVLQGSNKPPPLKDAAIGYDSTSSSIIIFGGESQAGLAQSQTYLLDLNSLSWRAPASPDNLGTSPPARSAALYGDDFAASNRHGFVVIGGKGLDGKPLSDVWEYSYTYQFWSQVKLGPGGPSARYSAAGGIDSRVTPVSDPIIPGPNNTFYMAGGFDGQTGESLSELWRLGLSGTLSSNLPNSVQGSWNQLQVGNFPSVVGPASTVVSSTIISTGGCNTSSVTDSSCVTQNSYKLDLDAPTTATECPAPRKGACMVPNMNPASSNFGSQVLLLLGTVDTSKWSDDNGSQKGEVAILNTGTGAWTRVLPSGDPGTSGEETFPTAREGSVAVSSSSALVGSGGSKYSDTIVFGGQDSSGNYLSEVWLLRAYSDTISPSKSQWSGFGNGRLQTGVNSAGTGVKVQYLNSCATQRLSSPTATTSGHNNSPTGSSPSSPDSPTQSAQSATYDTSLSHKILSPASLAVFLPAFLLFRSYSPPYNTHEHSPQHIAVVYCSGILIFVSYALGVAGFALGFTSLSFTPATSSALSKRSVSSTTNLRTSHGRAALAFFLGLYGLVPLLCLLAILYRPSSQPNYTSPEADREEERELATATSIETAEKLRTRNPRSPTQSIATFSRPSSPRNRTHSWGPSTLWRSSHERRISNDSDSVSSSPQRTFEVMNRPGRVRRFSTGLNIPPAEPRGISRSLGEIDWLQRRRSVGAVGELDYALTQAIRARDTPSTPATMEAMLLAPTLAEVDPRPELPSSLQLAIRFLLHIFLIGLCGVSLAALWSHAPKATFAVFLAWLVLFYVVLVIQAWYQYPHTSILATMITRLRAEPRLPPSQSYPTSTTPPLDQYPFPTTPHESPYVHDPPFRVASDDQSNLGPRSVENDNDDDDEDEDARQSRIESEMGRREIAIVTTQLRRKLWVANPS